MKNEIKMVKEFHDAYGLDYSENPTKNIPDGYRDLRIKLIQEEFDKMVKAINRETIGDTARSIAELQYAIFHLVFAMGLQDNFPELFAEVHQIKMNMLVGEPSVQGE